MVFQQLQLSERWSRKSEQVSIPAVTAPPKAERTLRSVLSNYPNHAPLRAVQESKSCGAQAQSVKPGQYLLQRPGFDRLG